jgi:hypothetical protein
MLLPTWAIVTVQTTSFPPAKPMTAAERLYQLIQALPEDQITEILHFAEFLHQKQLATVAPPQAIPPGTLTGLRGIAKQPGTAPSDEDLQTDYTDYLTQKYLSPFPVNGR